MYYFFIKIFKTNEVKSKLTKRFCVISILIKNTSIRLFFLFNKIKSEEQHFFTDAKYSSNKNKNNFILKIF